MMLLLLLLLLFVQRGGGRNRCIDKSTYWKGCWQAGRRGGLHRSGRGMI